MCTVTIIPTGNNNFVLTSNRDEAPSRTSLPPQYYKFQNSRLLFPKDEKSGGTWIGVSDKNRVVCVLNGGFEFYERKLNYEKSRGVIAKELMAAEDVIDAIEAYNFVNIEPFTMVIADWNLDLKCIELVWDGAQTHLSQLALEPKIWSSSTLYSEEMKEERLQWFKYFKLNNRLNGNAVLKFHETAGCGNLHYGVVMDRGFVKTTSITQIEKEGEKVIMSYRDLQKNEKTFVTFNSDEIIN